MLSVIFQIYGKCLPFIAGVQLISSLLSQQLSVPSQTWLWGNYAQLSVPSHHIWGIMHSCPSHHITSGELCTGGCHTGSWNWLAVHALCKIWQWKFIMWVSHSNGKLELKNYTLFLTQVFVKSGLGVLTDGQTTQEHNASGTPWGQRQ